jgi:predicted ATP-grasp superfamily ATP-dependent carboligase
MHNVLVLDANQRSALAIIRSLGQRGLRIIAADHQPHPIGGASRYVATSIRYADPATYPRAFTQDVKAAADSLGIDVIIPATDLTTMLLASQPDLSTAARLAMPNADSYESLTDKAQLIELAARLGVPAPLTQIALTADAVMDAAHSLGFPVVLKPARSKYLQGDQVLSTSVTVIRDAEDLADTLPRQRWLGHIPCLVQQFIPGHGAGVFALYGPDGPSAWFAHKRIREKPPGGGVSVLSESVMVNPIMQSAAEKLLGAAHWRGVAMVEFRVAEDGTPYLMEVNGRFWGSLQLAIDSGVDFPWLLYRLTVGLPVATVQHYHVGLRLRWLLGDFDSLLAELKSTSSGFGRKIRATSTFARSFADISCRQEVLRLHDPKPAVVEAWKWVRAL